MNVRKRIFAFLFAVLAMALLTACGRWDYSREAVKAANEAQGQTLRVEFKVNQTFTNALRAAVEDNIQPDDVDKAMTMDKSNEKLLTSGYRLDVYALRADIDADQAAAQLADEFINRLSGCEDEGYISMVKAENGYFYMAVLTYKHDSGSSDGGASDDDGASGGDEDDGFTGRWVDWDATTQTLEILPRASEKIGTTLTEDKVMEALEAQGEPTEGFSFSSVNALNIDQKRGVTKIGDKAFAGSGENRTLEYADLSGVETVGTTSFCFCVSLTTVEHTEHLKKVDDSGFTGCSSLDNADFTNVAMFGEYAFNQCWKLTQDDFDLSKIETMEEGALSETGITDISDLNSAITELPDYAFYGTKLTSVNMSHVKKIGECAFFECYELTTVNLPNVETIGKEAFNECVGLTSINLGQALKSVGKDAFLRRTKRGDDNKYPEYTDSSNLPALTIYYGQSSNENDFLQAIKAESLEDLGKGKDTWTFKSASEFNYATYGISNPAARFILSL